MSGPTIPDRDLDFETRFGAEMDDFGGKIAEISWMESGETWGKAISTQYTTNSWIKINKTSSNQQITKKFGGYFLVGIFKFRTKSSKRRLENGGRDSKFVINLALDTG